MSSIIDDIKSLYRNGDIVIRFLFINVAVFLFMTLVGIAGFFYKTDFVGAVLPWLSGSSDLLTLATRPWTILTYMFLHEEIWHLLGNMLILFYGGRLFTQFFSSKKYVAVYILSGLSGLATYLLAYNIFPVYSGASSIIYGASASVIGVLVAIATYTPNMEIRLLLIGNVKLKYVALFFVLVDLLFLDGSNSGGHVAHLGGALFGFLWSSSLKNGTDLAKPFYSIGDFVANLFKRGPKMKVASNSKGYKAQYYETHSKESKVQQQTIDKILEKISRSGYDSLSKEEKELLFKASKK